MRVPWTTRRSNQSILKEINLGISLEGLMLKLQFQYFGHLSGSVDSLEKTLMLGAIEGQEEKGTTEDEMAGWHHGLEGREKVVSVSYSSAILGLPPSQFNMIKRNKEVYYQTMKIHEGILNA